MLAGCVEPYAPAVINAPPRFLVVDGFVNADGPTRILLSRTTALSSKDAPPAERKARLVVEDEAGAVAFSLSETAPGLYEAPGLRLSEGRQYRLRITTAKGEQYASAYEVAKFTPPIESINWRAQDTGVNFYLNTNDPKGQSQYYRWEYDETWEIRSPYQPTVEYSDRAIRPIRSPYPFPLVCWTSNQSTRIILSKTTALTEDRVKDFRIRLLPSNSALLNRRYSLLVRQQTLTANEYAYWELLAKNTEQIGSLFDPQPSQLTGNVRRLDGEQAGELALGYVGVHSVTERRIFVSRTELPADVVPLTGYEDCLPPDIFDPFEIEVSPAPSSPGPGASGPTPRATREEARAKLHTVFADQSYLPIDQLTGSDIPTVTAKSRDCIDCRTRGTAVKPLFW
ncbi:DUF4249 domain-containing protein [Hymenobacter sp. ISL-91]|nr:DUF4249 domain-containing protein [Hymenobacter sp. ISL-91]